LKGEAIPLEGRIAAIADVFDALTSARAYKPAFPLDQTLEMMKEHRGKHFDPGLLDLFMDSLDDVMDIMNRYRPEPSPA
ncbi:MAG: HD-GYP domain-containing protein, partial [Dehalococcoidia bacterium]